jgi:hypothetical protein
VIEETLQRFNADGAAVGLGLGVTLTYTVHEAARPNRVVMSRVTRLAGADPGRKTHSAMHPEMLEVTLRGVGHDATRLSIVATVQRTMCPDPTFMLLCMPCFLYHLGCGKHILQNRAHELAKRIAARMDEAAGSPPDAPIAAAPMVAAPIAPPVVVVAEAVAVVAEPGRVPIGAAAQSMDRGGDLPSQMRELAEMNRQGVLSDSEFTAAKAKLLNSA